MQAHALCLPYLRPRGSRDETGERILTSGHNEAFSRILIDKALGASGWNLLDEQQVQLEHHGSSGRVDYLLKDNLGRVLCVLGAKREDLDPHDAKEQARGYAENLGSPFVICRMAASTGSGITSALTNVMRIE